MCPESVAKTERCDCDQERNKVELEDIVKARVQNAALELVLTHVLPKLCTAARVDSHAEDVRRIFRDGASRHELFHS